MQESTSLFEPLRNRAFLNYWLAGLSANFGWQIQLVGASWLMTALDGSPELVALVQTSVALPVMLLSVPGGAISDMVGQRSLVLWSQAGLMVVSFLLAACAFFDRLTPLLLLTFTFLVGSGRALYYPGWQSMVSELVATGSMTGAIAVNSSSVNIARSAGPALGGAIVASVGAFAAFVISAVSNLSVILVALRWQRHRPLNDLPPESFGRAMLVGLRYVALSPLLVTITLRATIFNVAAISVIALMPLVARELLDGGARTYGFLLGSFGIGAVIGALSIGLARARMSLEAVLAFSFIGFAAATIVLGYSHFTALSAAVSALAGVCWIFVQVSLNAAMQLYSPRWVLSRSNGIYQTFIFGGNAIGSLAWGFIAKDFGISASLAASGVVLALGAALGYFLRLRKPEVAGLAPHRQWVAPTPALDLVLGSGPIVTSIEYRIRQGDVPEFLRAMNEKRSNRARDGAFRWSLARDIEDADLWIERFEIPTWAETQRVHARRTLAGAKINEFIRSLHSGPQPPKVRYELVRDPVSELRTSAQILPRLDQ